MNTKRIKEDIGRHIEERDYWQGLGIGGRVALKWMDLLEIGFKNADCLTGDMLQSQAVVNTVINEITVYEGGFFFLLAE